MHKQVEIAVEINGVKGRGHVGRGTTLRAAVKDAAERATSDLSMMKPGDTATIIRLVDSVL